MVYHETRKENGKIKNYLVHNTRQKERKWKKNSKFIGYGNLGKKEIEDKKREFRKELIVNKNYNLLTKEQVKKIENLRDIYEKNVSSMKKEELKQFKEAFYTELTYNTNAIEGNTLSLQETSLVVNEGIAPKGKSLREIYEAKNHSEAINFIETLANSKNRKYKKELTEDSILKVHSIILKNISDRFAGKYRKRAIRVAGSDFNFPSPEKVPQLVKNLFYWYNNNKNDYHPFELAVLVSSKLVSIHPFIDGNGRVSRLVMNFILDKYGYPWLNIYTKQREEYLKAIRKANDKDYENLFKFLIKTMEENLEEFNFI